MEHVILVDENDQELGTMEKMQAHRQGLLHRAFSILLYNSKGEMLLQKRASNKYHSAGLWSNACCSHPRPGESMEDATRRRLFEELGIEAQPEFSYKFIYKVQFDNQLVEHELDHVYTVQYDGLPIMNKKEVDALEYIAPEELQRRLATHPLNYSYWFRLIMQRPELIQL